MLTDAPNTVPVGAAAGRRCWPMCWPMGLHATAVPGLACARLGEGR